MEISILHLIHIIGTDGIVWYYDGMKCMQESNQRGNGNEWVGGIILNLVPSAIQLGCVNSPVFKVENHIGKLVSWRDVSYSPKLTSLWKKNNLIRLL